MGSCRLQTAHHFPKFTNSSEAAPTCSLQASAESSAFIDVLQRAPGLLQAMSPRTMATLSSTSRRLRSLVHEYVTSISIIQHNGHGIQYQIMELQALTSGSWPHLRCLNIKYRAKLEAAAITQLSKASWSSLVSLDLSRNSLGADAMSQLVMGNWPALKQLNLSSNRLDTAAMVWLTQADWPLEELHLSDNRIDLKAMQELIQGSWPKLMQLTMRWNKLNAHTIAVLAKAEWPLRQLDLGQNQLDANAMTLLSEAPWHDLESLRLAGNYVQKQTHAAAIARLCQAAWPNLVNLDLSKCCLGGADIAGLCTASWPKLSSVYLGDNCLDEISMTYLVKTYWPALKFLCLCRNALDDAAVKLLMHSSWPQLEYLDLRENDELTKDAAIFSSNVLRCAAVF
ncbi:hypothetical protein ABBQ32_009267 [Trebouxia sp. C0010 RCD-2024]